MKLLLARLSSSSSRGFSGHFGRGSGDILLALTVVLGGKRGVTALSNLWGRDGGTDREVGAFGHFLAGRKR